LPPQSGIGPRVIPQTSPPSYRVSSNAQERVRPERRTPAQGQPGFDDTTPFGAFLPNQWYLFIYTYDLLHQFRRILESKSKRILALAAKRQILRSKDASALGVARNYLSRLVQKGLLKKLGRGIYTSPSSPVSEHLSLMQVACRVPKGVICLLSALYFHNLTSQSPREVWIAIDAKAWAPHVLSPKTRFIRMSGSGFQFGVKEHRVRGGTLRVYTPAKAVVDCFKFRNKIGIAVAVEALRECRRLKKASINEIWAAAKVCRLANVMRPYLESLW